MILARLLGMKLELSGLSVENIVPEKLRNVLIIELGLYCPGVYATAAGI